ncbi:very short patch repair endonuclease [uncultured Pontibacter sp.]|uniref:very short patch repair endonuclease n=1 Tax=uncultured Pontibacter sp. TaxID=453356 RepID=UPI00263056CE|nr:very short patch repair endonuclease [uncultured Pontibacter sp.]
MITKKFLRDTRSPVPKSTRVSRVMSANKSKNTKPEIKLRKQLFAKGLRGYRIHYKSIPGRPDIVFTKAKVAIFVNGCYWHRCTKCNLPLPKNNATFWKEKFKKNKHRDEAKASELESLGYKVLVIWECELTKELDVTIERIKAAIFKQ